MPPLSLVVLLKLVSPGLVFFSFCALLLLMIRITKPALVSIWFFSRLFSFLGFYLDDTFPLCLSEISKLKIHMLATFLAYISSVP